MGVDASCSGGGCRGCDGVNVMEFGEGGKVWDASEGQKGEDGVACVGKGGGDDGVVFGGVFKNGEGRVDGERGG